MSGRRLSGKPSASRQRTPFCEGGVASSAKNSSAGEVAVQVEMIVHGGMNSDEPLEGRGTPEPQHGPFSSSERQVRVLGAIVQPSSRDLLPGGTEVAERRPVRPEPIRHDNPGRAMPSQGFPQESQGGLAVAALRDEAFQHLALVVDGAPEIPRLAVDLHEHLVDMPSPVDVRPHRGDPPAADLSSEERSEPQSPQPDRLMADVNAALMEEVFDVSKRQREADIHHHGQSNDLGRRLEVPKWAMGHGAANLRLTGRSDKPRCLDTASLADMSARIRHVRFTSRSGSAADASSGPTRSDTRRLEEGLPLWPLIRNAYQTPRLRTWCLRLQPRT